MKREFFFHHLKLWVAVVGENLTKGEGLASYRPFGYERVYLPLCKVADTPFHIQGVDMPLSLQV